MTDSVGPCLSAYERCRRASEDTVTFFAKYDPEEVVHDREFTRVFLNHIELVSSHIELGLLNWRRGVRPVEDFERAYSAFQELERFLAKSAPDHGAGERVEIRDHIHDFFGIVFSLIGRPVTLEELEGERLEFKYLHYVKYVASLLQNTKVAEAVKQHSLSHMRHHRAVIDQSTLTYLMLLNEAPPDASVDELVRRAESLWLQRATDRYFDEFTVREGYGEYNEVFVDYTLGAILKKIGWQGESVHLWKWG